MENRETINVLLHHKEAFEISGKTADAIDMAISALEKQEQIIEFIESRKQLHSSPAWYEFGIVKELDEVKRYVEKM